jgi:hypothetical protein
MPPTTQPSSDKEKVVRLGFKNLSPNRRRTKSDNLRRKK